MFEGVVGFIVKVLGPGLVLGIALGGALLFWWDRRPPHVPSLDLHAPAPLSFIGVRLEAPESLAAQAQDARAALAALQNAELTAAARARAVEATDAAISAAAGAADAAAQARIRTVTRTIIQEIPGVLPPAVDRAFPLPVGFVRVHDAAARGLDLSDVPDPAGRPDDAASGVAASDAAAVIAGNYGACRADAQRLADLQAWDRAVAAAQTSP